MNQKTKNLVLISLFSAVAFIAMLLIKVPVVAFLSYEPKDVVITLAGFIINPMASVVISIIVSVIEMITVSTTGIIGLIMNILSTVAFTLPVTLMYHRNRKLKSAIIGLVISTTLMTLVMVLWNILVTPTFLGVPRPDVIAMLVPVFIPFNILKGALNAGLVLLLYKPLMKALKGAKLIKSSDKPTQSKPLIFFVSLVFVITIVLLILMFNGTI